jgi:hypothetical protein
MNKPKKSVKGQSQWLIHLGVLRMRSAGCDYREFRRLMVFDIVAVFSPAFPFIADEKTLYFSSPPICYHQSPVFE